MASQRLHSSADSALDPRFREFIELFARIGSDERIFPKKCNACGKMYRSFPEYIHATTPAGHALEDCTDVMQVPYAMQYRNCRCGTTLVLSITEETYPLIERFWNTLREIASEEKRPLAKVVSDFRDQCNRYVKDVFEAESKTQG